MLRPALWVGLNVDGSVLLPLLRKVPELRTALVALNFCVDADQIIRAVNGDVSLAVSEGATSLHDWLFTAQLQNQDFLRNVLAWQRGGMFSSIARFVIDGEKDFRLVGDDFEAYFGMRDGSLYVLYGSLAPDGAMIKAAAVEDSMRQFAGPARCFDSLAAGLAALDAGEIKPGDVCVLRYLGPKGAFGTTSYQFQKELKGRGLAHDVAIVTDGRFSGGSSGLSIGYLSPEAALGSPLALVRDGDRIEIDLDKRRIDLAVSEAELAERRKAWNWKFDPKGVHPYLRLFAKNAGSLANGAIWEL